METLKFFGQKVTLFNLRFGKFTTRKSHWGHAQCRPVGQKDDVGQGDAGEMKPSAPM